jgi:arylsulfatase A-like enzyme
MAGAACPGPSKQLVYDLAARISVADRWSAREVVLFGTPAAEPHQAEGFYREAGVAEGDSFLWAGSEAEVALTWDQPVPRSAILDLAPYVGVKGQSAEVRLNATSIGSVTLNDARHRYRLSFPTSAQKAGDNRLRFVFAKTGSPADADPKSGDHRRLAAAFYTLTVGREGDAPLEDLLGRDAARPFSITLPKGAPPVLTEVGPAALRYAIRLPPRAELRFTPDLHAAARTAAGSARFRVTVEEKAGEEQEVWSRVVDARAKAPGEVVVALPGQVGSIVRVGLHVGPAAGATGERFAWGNWTSPRILGEGGAEAVEAPRYSADDDRRGEPLRRTNVGFNVLLIILDAARAQEFGCYGYARATTPTIDKIASEGVVFENVFTPAVYTLGAMSSVWTSQYPDRHHSEVSFSARLPKDRLTLPDVLSARGILTAGFVANAVAGTAFGFERGFSEFHETFREHGSGAGAFRKVFHPWLHKNKDKPFFAYVHFREPHFPYDPAPPFDTRFGPDGPIRKAARGETAWITDVNQGRRKLTPEEGAHLVRLYDGNLAFADQEIGAIRKAMQDDELWDRTVVIIAADHGEELFEHQWIGHNVHVYDESAKVPLVIRFPPGKGPDSVRIQGLADLLDLAPTIADLYGARGQGGWEKQFQGRSLLPMIGGAPGKPAVLSRTVWDRPIYALRDERFKFVYDTRTGEEKLFEIAADPGEGRDLRATEPLRAAYYREALHEWIAKLGRRVAGESAVEGLTPEQCANMTGLGYVVVGCK